MYLLNVYVRVVGSRQAYIHRHQPHHLHLYRDKSGGFSTGRRIILCFQTIFYCASNADHKAIFFGTFARFVATWCGRCGVSRHKILLRGKCRMLRLHKKLLRWKPYKKKTKNKEYNRIMTNKIFTLQILCTLFLNWQIWVYNVHIT